MCSHVYVKLAQKLKQTPALIVFSVCIRFISYRWQSHLISFTMKVVVSQTWHALFSVQKGRAFNICSTCPDCFSVLWHLLSSEPKQKKDDCKREESMSVCFSWSDLEPLFRKQKQAVWLTARDNAKVIKTYYYSTTFAECLKLLFWVTVMLSNKLQVCRLWNQHPLTSNACTIHWSDKDTNTDSLIYGSSCFSHFLEAPICDL